MAACSLLLSYDGYDRDFGRLGDDGASADDAGPLQDAGAERAVDADVRLPCPPEPTCDADLQVDTDNCGACNHRCLPATAKCGSGLCGIDPAFVYPAVSPKGVAVDDNYLYGVGTVGGSGWEGGAARIPKDNVFARKIIAAGATEPRRMVVRGTDVFWTQRGGIGRSPSDTLPDGGPNTATLMVSGQTSPYNLAVDDTHVYWTNDSAAGGDVWRASIASPADAQAIAAPQSAYGIAVDGRFVYWTSNMQGGAVWRANKDGTSPTKIASDQSYPAGIFVDDRAVYWTNKSLSGSVLKLVKGATVPQTLAADRTQPDTIVVRDPYVYWDETGPDRQDIVRLPSCGGSGLPLRIAVKQDVLDLAVDGTHVYWATGAFLLRVPR